MKDIRQTLLDRVTVRRYEREAIPAESFMRKRWGT